MEARVPVPSLPRHVAIIMDGNGRWAESRGLSRTEGHRKGSESVRSVTREARKIGLDALTLYAFSSQNWGRPDEEVGALMMLLAEYLDSERAEILDNRIRLHTIGDTNRLPGFVRERLESVRAASARNDGMQGCHRDRGGVGFRRGDREGVRTRGRQGRGARHQRRGCGGGRARDRPFGNCVTRRRHQARGHRKRRAQDLDSFGKLDIVVNNAGWSHKNRPMLEVSEEEFDRVYAVNVKSIYHMAFAAVPVLAKAGGGVIVNIGSTAGIRPRPGFTWYNGSKGAVNLMSRSMAVELAPQKIRVNCVAPVMGATGLLEQFMGLPDTPENRAKFIATVPLGRLSEPKDIASACLYLASDEAEFITGVVLEVDGGRTI